MNRFFMGLALTGALAACGGGGDGPAFTPASTSFPLEAAYKAYVSGPNVYTYDVSGSCGGSASETTSAPVAATFQGAPAQVKTTTLRITRESCVAIGPEMTPVLPPGTDTAVGQTFYDSNLRPLGASIPATGMTVVYTGGAAIPATVKVGDSAVISSGAGVSVSYAVEADAETSVIVKLTTISTALAETSSYRLTAAGALTLLRHEIFLPNNIQFTLTPE